METIFTKIINGEVAADIVYEDAWTLAFLDIHPVRKGHTLVIPKKAFENLFDGDPEYLGHMIATAQKVAQAILKATDATGVNLHMNNGHHAGQDVMHAHMHIIPRTKRGETFLVPDHETYAQGEDAALAKKIKALIL
jgi:histidine triad (HIT) family protein